MEASRDSVACNWEGLNPWRKVIIRGKTACVEVEGRDETVTVRSELGAELSSSDKNDLYVPGDVYTILVDKATDTVLQQEVVNACIPCTCSLFQDMSAFAEEKEKQ